jgi:hypothetical protein
MSSDARTRRDRPLIGWREWVRLPGLFDDAVKAKIDTGARTSALHAFQVREFSERGVRHVEFVVHPQQQRRQPQRSCVAEVADQRVITSSNGQRERRYVIVTPLQLGSMRWDIELTLTNRDTMSYRMLLGREALKRHCLIHPGRSFLQPLAGASTHGISP